MNLIIVESPAKARTISKFLGKNYAVEACMGHIRDLPKGKLGVDTKHDFSPTYVAVPKQKKVIRELKKKTGKAQKVYLGTDNDREGESISWHLKEILELKNEPIRIIFNEITHPAIQQALKNPHEICASKVNAQQARRILDRLVGYKVSPILWKKVRKGLSAGRVQSVAVRLICEREEEINSFVPEEYWIISTDLKQEEGKEFRAKLEKIGKEKAKISSEIAAQTVLRDLEGKPFTVKSIEKKEGKRCPPAPFTTSSLQQEAYRILRFRIARTMRIAQQLYEGLDIGKEETTGLITYMRTDSVQISKEARQECAGFIREKFGAEYAPQKARQYKSKKGAQEAHEAIRPTDVRKEPLLIKDYLTTEQFRLYSLIWHRFIASQCKNAAIATTLVKIAAGKYEFHVKGIEIRFPGFLAVLKSKAEKKEELPALKKGEVLKLIKIFSEQHFTKPPARYTEGTLVKLLEEKGIGRPSTYAPTINTIQKREYIERENGRLLPTKLGIIVNGLLVKNFESYFNVKFTAEMETDLDKIEEGKLDWVQVLHNFYEPFETSIEEAQKHIESLKKSLEEETDKICQKCGGKMVIKWGRYGRFLACSNFPKCKNSQTLIVETGVKCPRPECGGKIIEKKSKRGRIFYGCSNYPNCDYASWGKPVPVKCEKCGADFLIEKRKGGSKILVCAHEGCDYSRQEETAEEPISE